MSARIISKASRRTHVPSFSSELPDLPFQDGEQSKAINLAHLCCQRLHGMAHVCHETRHIRNHNCHSQKNIEVPTRPVRSTSETIHIEVFKRILNITEDAIKRRSWTAL